MKKFFANLIVGIVIVNLATSMAANAITTPPSTSSGSVDCSLSARLGRQEFYSANDIYFTDPCATACTSTAQTVAQLSGSDNEQKIYNFWVSQGLSPAQAAGITGSLQSESGFSPFRQQVDPTTGQLMTWPTGGYGIAQFTGGQRVQATAALSADLKDVFTQYYLPTYGNGVTAATGFVPAGIPVTVNDQFLLSELNYLSGYIASFAPSTISERTSRLATDYNITIPTGQKLLDFLKTLTSAGDAAKAWTYLYEYPGNIAATAAARATNADAVLAKYSGGVTGCVSGSSIVCPGSSSSAITTGDGSTTAIVSTAKCITIQPTAGSKSSRDLGVAACTSGGCTSGPPTPANYAAARRLYKTAGSSGTNDSFDNYGADCGNFVSTVMRMSGADPGFPISGVGSMYDYMTAHPEKYQKITTTSSTASLQPGDILTEVTPDFNGHILIYLGDGVVAQASQATQMPVQELAWGMNGNVWRMIK